MSNQSEGRVYFWLAIFLQGTEGAGTFRPLTVKQNEERALASEPIATEP